MLTAKEHSSYAEIFDFSLPPTSTSQTQAHNHLTYYVKEALPSSAYVNIKLYDTLTHYAYEKDITDKWASRFFDKYTTPSCGESVYVSPPHEQMQDEHESLKTHDVTWHKPSIASRNEQDRSQHRAALCEACIMWGSCTGTFVEPYVTSLAAQLLYMMETSQHKENGRQLDLPGCSWQARGGNWKNTAPTATEAHASTWHWQQHSSRGNKEHDNDTWGRNWGEERCWSNPMLRAYSLLLTCLHSYMLTCLPTCMFTYSHAYMLVFMLPAKDSCLPPRSTAHMRRIFDFSLAPTSTAQIQAQNDLT